MKMTSPTVHGWVCMMAMPDGITHGSIPIVVIITDITIMDIMIRSTGACIPGIPGIPPIIGDGCHGITVIWDGPTITIMGIMAIPMATMVAEADM